MHSETLLNLGILDQRVPQKNLLAAATDMAEHYVSKPPIAAQMIKQSTNQITNALNHALMHMDADQNLLAASSDDRKEAIKSYMEKSAPTFTGN
jgi:enoyl-CoA hydratase/carnithine racemase